MEREDRQNRRQELKRLADFQEGDEGGSAARRTRGAWVAQLGAASV